MVDIYATLFDQDQVMEDYIASLRREIREEADERISKESERVSRETTEKITKENEKASKETVLIMYQDKIPVHKIAGYLRKDPKIIEAWLGLGPQE